MPQPIIERRLSALERDVADLKSRLCPPPAGPSDGGGNWLSSISGSMRGEPDFDEVVRLGRAIRQADRPANVAGQAGLTLFL